MAFSRKFLLDNGVPEDKVDALMGRKEEPKDEQVSYELHQTVIKLGKAEAEIRDRDKQIAELTEKVTNLTAELEEAQDTILEAAEQAPIIVSEPSKASAVSDICAQQLRLSIRLLDVVADYMEESNVKEGAIS